MSAFVTKPSTSAFIDGDLAPAADGATYASLEPASGQLLVDVAAGGSDDIDRAVSAARRAFEAGVWSNAAPAVRKRTLLKFADLLEADLTNLAELESREAGKPIADCETLDLPDAIACIRWYAEAIDKTFGKIGPSGNDSLSLITREPMGVVGAVLPWNFPAATLSWKIGPALAAGNSVVVKPPELASLSTIRFAELAAAAGLPDGVFNVVPGLGHVAGRALGLHDDVNVVTFTGSTEVGREFLRYSADSNLKQVVLECGGKSPQLVLASAGVDLGIIAEDLAAAAFWNAGQVCTAGSRIIVHEALHAELVERLSAAANALVLGDPVDRSTTLGPMIEAAAVDKTIGYIDGAIEAGARVASGGRRGLEESGGFFVEPTVLDAVTENMAVAREEIFGPVVSVLTVDSTEEAVRIANDSDYGLDATVWSSNFDEAIRVARALRSGTVGINGYSEGDITTPFGGYKTSGFGGRDKGLEAFDQYTELKTIFATLR